MMIDAPISRARAHQSLSAVERLWLVPIQDSEHVHPWPLADESITIGSASTCDIFLPIPGVDAHHCTIRLNNGRAVLTAHSRLTWVNEGPVRETVLKPGQRLAIGPIEFRLKKRIERHVPEPLDTLEHVHHHARREVGLSPADLTELLTRLTLSSASTAARPAAPKDVGEQHGRRPASPDSGAAGRDLERRLRHLEEVQAFVQQQAATALQAQIEAQATQAENRKKLQRLRKAISAKHAALREDRADLAHRQAELERRASNLQREEERLNIRGSELQQTSEQLEEERRQQYERERLLQARIEEMNRQEAALAEREAEWRARQTELTQGGTCSGTSQQAQTESTAGAHDETRQRLEELERSHQGLHEELRRKNRELEQLASTHAEQQNQFAERERSLELRLSELEEARGRLQAEREQLAREQDDLRNESDRLETQRNQLDADRGQLTDEQAALDADRRRVEQERADLDKERKRVADRRRQWETQQQELRLQEARIAEQLADVEQRQQELVARDASLRQREDELDAANQQLRSSHDDAEQSQREAEIERARHELDELRASLRQEREALEAHRTELQEAEHNLDTIRGMLATAQKDTQRERAALEATRDELSKEQQRLDALRRESGREPESAADGRREDPITSNRRRTAPPAQSSTAGTTAAVSGSVDAAHSDDYEIAESETAALTRQADHEIVDETDVDETPSEQVIELRSQLADLFSMPPAEEGRPRTGDASSRGASLREAVAQSMTQEADPSTESADAPTESDSIAAYMENLMARIRSGSPSRPVAAAVAKPSRYQSQPPEAPANPETKEEPASLDQPAADAERLKDRHRPDAMLEREHINALRELANRSARTAVAKHNAISLRRTFLVQAIITGVLLALTVLLMTTEYWADVSYALWVFPAAAAVCVSAFELLKTFSKLNVAIQYERQPSDDASEDAVLRTLKTVTGLAQRLTPNGSKPHSQNDADEADGTGSNSLR